MGKALGYMRGRGLLCAVHLLSPLVGHLRLAPCRAIPCVVHGVVGPAHLSCLAVVALYAVLFIQRESREVMVVIVDWPCLFEGRAPGWPNAHG